MEVFSKKPFPVQRAKYTALSAIIGLQAHQDPVFLDMRIDSNTQYDFAEFVYAAIINKYLESGDILIMDNASVHSGQDSFVEVLETLEDSGIGSFSC